MFLERELGPLLIVGGLLLVFSWLHNDRMSRLYAKDRSAQEHGQPTETPTTDHRVEQ
jgi:hypothetical protein